MTKRMVIAIVVFFLAGLSATSAYGEKAKAPAGGGFCDRVGSIEWATVRRVKITANKYAPFGFPARIQITAPARARALATAICKLPLSPGTGRFCTSDLGIRYRVRFREVGLVTIDPGGCETVTGTGPARWAARTPRFWQKLGRALGLKGATRRTFAGSFALD